MSTESVAGQARTAASDTAGTAQAEAGHTAGSGARR